MIVSTCGPFSQLDAVLAVYTGNAVNALTEVASNDDGIDPGTFPECRGTDSEIHLAATAGTTYRIAVDGTGGTVGRFNLRIHGRPENDSFATPRVLSPTLNSSTGVTDNKLATKEPGEPDHAGVPGGSSVWFSWTPTESGPVTVDACPVFEGPLEAVVGVYTGSAVNNLTEVASSAGVQNVVCSAAGGEASFAAVAGTTYRIAVDGKNASEGQFQLSFEGPESDDAFANAQTLQPEPSISNAGNTRRASKEPGEPDHAGNPPGHSLWFEWTPTTSGPFVLTACPYGDFAGDPVLAVYTGSTLGRSPRSPPTTAAAPSAARTRARSNSTSPPAPNTRSPSTRAVASAGSSRWGSRARPKTTPSPPRRCCPANRTWSAARPASRPRNRASRTTPATPAVTRSGTRGRRRPAARRRSSPAPAGPAARSAPRAASTRCSPSTPVARSTA